MRYGAGVATVAECWEALQQLATRLSNNADEARRKLNTDRTLACRLTDHDAAFRARLAGGVLVDLAAGDDPSAQIAITTTSDDLIALINGELDVGRALATRRVSLRASPWDLLKLRSLL